MAKRFQTTFHRFHHFTHNIMTIPQLTPLQLQQWQEEGRAFHLLDVRHPQPAYGDVSGGRGF